MKLLALKLKSNFYGIVATAAPPTGLAVSLTNIEQSLRIAVLAVTLVSSCVCLYFHIKKNRS